ncbi:hypothetical protein SAMN02745216_00149 [Desulfatibacillum alkenivorans DSM 16219]|uniref:Uncharacterized protein n=1 Tax=Desulfatibacillum alkenivorans DSM 16219 TaxID=1121393 RepID=A0A1M6C4L3_9BACT|nr:hypothetical protein SAMN02745216_00149 [Desulfatibacillum alkenivorans DSM 16219]
MVNTKKPLQAADSGAHAAGRGLGLCRRAGGLRGGHSQYAALTGYGGSDIPLNSRRNQGKSSNGIKPGSGLWVCGLLLKRQT